MLLLLPLVVLSLPAAAVADEVTACTPVVVTSVGLVDALSESRVLACSPLGLGTQGG